MNSADLLSIVINLLVGLYFALLYPRTLARRFGGHSTPRAFVLLQKVVPPAGWLIIAITLIYALTLLLQG